MRCHPQKLIGLLFLLVVLSLVFGASKDDAASKIKIHWTNVGAYTYGWKADIENSDDHRTISVAVTHVNDSDALHPITETFVMGPHTFQTVGMFKFNNGVKIKSAEYKK